MNNGIIPHNAQTQKPHSSFPPPRPSPSSPPPPLQTSTILSLSNPSKSGTLNPSSPSSHATLPTLSVHATTTSLATTATISTLNGSSDFSSVSTCFPRLLAGKVVDSRLVALDPAPMLERGLRRAEGREELRASERGQWVSFTGLGGAEAEECVRPRRRRTSAGALLSSPL